MVILGNYGPHGAEICLPKSTDLKHLPAAMQTYYSLVGEVRWCSLGSAGGLNGPDHNSMDNSMYDWQSSPALDKTKTFQFGVSENGTPLVYTVEGKAGWWTSESHNNGLHQSIEEVVEWVYREMLEGRNPVAQH